MYNKVKADFSKWGDIMEFIQKISDICSNQGYAAIIAALISAVVAIAVAIYNKHKKDISDSPSQSGIVIPPAVDPLSDLQADTAGIKDIDKADFNSLEYARTLATRLDLLKNPKSQADVFYGDDSDD